MEKLPLKHFGRSLSDFGQLTIAEQKLLEACRNGTMAVISEIRPEQANKNNTISASFLRFLALGGDESAPVHEKGVALHGAWIDGEFDVESSVLPRNLALSHCYLSNIILRNSKAYGFVSFYGCHVNDLIADRIDCNNSIYLIDGFIATGKVQLNGAQIGCDLVCNKGEFHGKDELGIVLSCAGAVINGNVSLIGFTANGNVCLFDAQIGGSLFCTNALVNNSSSVNSLACDRAVIRGGVFLSGNFTGTVRLFGVQIGSTLICDNGKFDGKGSDALTCEGAIINGNVFLRNGFIALGTVRLRGTQIVGVLDCNNGNFDGKEADALMCEDMMVRDTVFLNEGFIALGTFRLRNAQIGCLICKGRFDGNGSNALLCDGVVIKDGVFLNAGFSAIGEVRFLEAQIGGSLECWDARFSKAQFVSKTQNTGVAVNKQPDTLRESVLTCDRAVINGNVFLVNGFIANGTVRLLGVQIGNNLDCYGATFDCANGIALFADGMTVAGAFNFYNLALVKGVISLYGVKVGNFIDDFNPLQEMELKLDGFVYDKFAGIAATDAKTRIAWLDKQSKSDSGLESFKPQPWQQLQKVLREIGHIEDARKIGIEFEDPMRRAKRVYNPILHWINGFFLGYGYHPLRLFMIMLAVWLACGDFYWYAALYGNQGDGVFAPSNPLVFQNPEYNVCKADKDESKFELHEFDCTPPTTKGAGNWYLCANLREEYTGFSPLAYSLDLILPLVDLQQEGDWSPMIPTPKDNWISELSELSLKHWTRLVVWFEILFGWVASLLLVAVVSGLTKRREE